jgi:hypothetical protein
MRYFGSRSAYNVQTGLPTEAPVVINLSNAASWAAAETSLAVQGPVSPEVADARAAACRQCERLLQQTEPKDSIGWCGACGCGTGARAALSVKVTMPAAKCPLGRWSATPPPAADPSAKDGPAPAADPAKDGGEAR